MYKSPIEIFVSDMETEIANEQEKEIFKAIQRIGVNVDKDELVKALQYDRTQYEVGYEDGIRIVLNRLQQFLERSIEQDDEHIERSGRVMSNADRIRAMTDEEMAKYSKGYGCPHVCTTKYINSGTNSCYKCWLDWLKQKSE